TMNAPQPAASNGSDPVKMLERGIAMGKDLAGEGQRDEIPWGTVITAAATGLSLLKKSKADEKNEEKKEEAKEKPKSNPPPSPKPAEAPVPFAPNLPPNTFIDPRTGIAYTYHPSLGYIPFEQALALLRAYGAQYQAPPQPHYSYPVGVPNIPPPTPPQPMPIAAPPLPIAPPPAPVVPPQPPPPQTTRMAPSPRPVPHPVPPPPPPVAPAPEPHVQKPQQPPATERSPRPQAIVEPRQTSKQPAHSAQSKPVVQNAMADPGGDLPDLIGNDFDQVVNEGMNSPEAQKIMQDPRYQALRDAVVNGEMTVDD
ncbi:MAG TPA: hypothetical protein PK156_50130, partial [Polyangium sp.]|nr:hypothetical protein [Polyangium sp.]